MADQYECPGCGYHMDPSEKECKYCGTKNPNYREPVQQRIIEPALTQTRQVVQQSSKKMSVGIFILLLIFFWPGAIIYAIVCAAK